MNKIITDFNIQYIGIIDQYVRWDGRESELSFIVEFKNDRKPDNFDNLKKLLENIFNQKVDLLHAGSITEKLLIRIRKNLIYIEG